MQSKAQKFLAVGVVTLMVLMPFHAFLVIYLGKLFGYQAVFQGWKEALIMLMTLAAGWLLITRPTSRRQLYNWPNFLIVTFAAISLIVSAASKPDLTAFLFGVKTDLLFLLLFVLAQLIASKKLSNQLSKILIGTTAMVVIFGFLQATILPSDFLASFGYSASTIIPVQKVDPAVNSVRVMSTLGGPNQLGTFLILPMCIMLAMIIRKRRFWLLPLLALSGFVLVQTFSRSAWIGALVALTITTALSLPKRLLPALLITCLIGAFGAGLLVNQSIRDQSTLQYYFLHGRFINNKIRGSDKGRVSSLLQGLNQVKAVPLGMGLGTSGPASKHNKVYTITENYYLQLAIETGVIGLMVFLAIIGALAFKLIQHNSHSILAAPLLGTLVGISVVNLFLHGWTDSSTALVYWATAGAVLGEHQRSKVKDQKYV